MIRLLKSVYLFVQYEPEADIGAGEVTGRLRQVETRGNREVCQAGWTLSTDRQTWTGQTRSEGTRRDCGMFSISVRIAQRLQVLFEVHQLKFKMCD